MSIIIKFMNVAIIIIAFTLYLLALSEGQSKGPKAPNQTLKPAVSTVKPAISTLKPGKSPYRRVFVGEAVKVPCLTAKAKTMYSVGANATYAWSQGKDANTLGVRYAVQANGDLYITNLEASDSQILTCKVLAKSAETLEFNHQLSVVSVPDVAVGLILQYDGEKCVTEVKKILKEKIQVLIEDPICKTGKVCVISDILVACLKSEVGVKYQITLKTGVRSKLNYPCTEDCPKPPGGPGPKQVRKSLHDLFTKQTIDIAEPKVTLKTPKIHDVKEGLSCIGGFVLNSEVCEPCAPGQYKRDMKVCGTCSANSYSEYYAATECQRCPKNEITPGPGSDSSSDCIEFDTIATVIVSILFIIIFIIIPCCGPCALVFYRYYRRTVLETGEEPHIIGNIRLFFSVIKEVILRIVSKKTEGEDIPLSEDQTPLIGGDTQGIYNLTQSQGPPGFVTVPQTTLFSSPESAAAHKAGFAIPPGGTTVHQTAPIIPPGSPAVQQATYQFASAVPPGSVAALPATPNVPPGIEAAHQAGFAVRPPPPAPVISAQPTAAPQSAFSPTR